MPIQDRRRHERRQQNLLVLPIQADRKNLAITDVDLTARDVLVLLAAAIDRTFESRKEAAFQLGVPEDRLSKWLNPDARERFPVTSLLRNRYLFRAFAEMVLKSQGAVIQQPDKWTQLWLVATRCIRVFAVRVERQLKSDLGR